MERSPCKANRFSADQEIHCISQNLTVYRLVGKNYLFKYFGAIFGKICLKFTHILKFIKLGVIVVAHKESYSSSGILFLP